MIDIEQVKEPRDPAFTAEHIVAATRKQKRISPPRDERRPKLTRQDHLGKRVAPVRHVVDRVAIRRL